MQGVFFRGYASRWAAELGLSGYVRNRPEGSLEVRAEGDRDRLERLVKYLEEGTPASRVEKVVTDWSEYTGSYSGFRVEH